MSTKIYGGMKLKDGFDIYDATRAVYPKIVRIFEEESYKIIAQYFSKIIDFRQKSLASTTDDPNKKPFLLQEARRLFAENLANRKEFCDDRLDFSMSFGLVKAGAVKPGSKEKTLACYFGSIRPYQQVIDDSGMFEEYCYFDNADPDDEYISEEDWELRGLEWEAIWDERESFASLPYFEVKVSPESIFNSHIYIYDYTVDLNELKTPQDRFVDKVYHSIKDMGDPSFAKIFKISSYYINLMVKEMSEGAEYVEHYPKPFPSQCDTIDENTEYYELPDSVAREIAEKLLVKLETFNRDDFRNK